MNNNRLPQGLRVYGPLVVLAVLARSAIAAEPVGEPLHCRIDRLIDSARVGPPAPQAGDAEFLRRLSLDLAGMPPSVDDLREFLADKRPDKRARKIDRLLSSPLFTRHWATTLDVMLMERRPNVHVPADEWKTYLLRAAQSNRPLNHVLSELLTANGADPKLRPAARFYLDRGSEPNLITRDVGRIFFGRDMQCAQCHNHPLVKDYQQSDYYGLLAFISPGYAVTRKEGKNVVTFHAEKAGTDLTFDSVFVKNDKHVTGPRVPGETELPEPATPPGEEYQVKPADGVIAVPKFSRRVKLASLTTGGTNRAFNQNIANRLWAVMMGRGLVHPVDLHHPSNPPSHPELLNLLAGELVTTGFNVRSLLREIALTKVYQQAIDLPPADAAFPPDLAAQLANEKARAEPLEVSAEAARKKYLSAVKAWYQNEEALIPLLASQDKATAKYVESEKKKEAARKAQSDAQAQLIAKQETARALAEAAARGQEVAKKLPKDKELLDAAAIFTKRAAAASAELATLQKTIADRTAALKKASDDVATAAQAVLAARAKASPVREAVRQKEKLALEARRKMVETRSVAEIQLKRLKLLESFARCQKLHLQITESNRASVALANALAAAKKSSAELEVPLRRNQEEMSSADRTRAAAEKTRSDAHAALELHQKIAASVQAALAATEAARQLLPDDSALSLAAQKIKEKSAELRAAGLPLQARLDAAVGSFAEASDRQQKAQAALQVCLAEKARRQKAVTVAASAQAAEDARRKNARSELAEAEAEFSTLRASQFAQALLKPLTPEQICFSILKVTGVYDRYQKAEEADLDKKQSLVVPAAFNPLFKISRAIELERRTYEKLKSTVPAFVSIYAAAPGQPQNDFFATADQALFAANGGSINSWIAPAGGNVSDRMIREKDPHKAADDLYMTILSRPPLPDESADVVRMLTARPKEKAAVVQELVWALLNSVEFRFNH
jgi:Protein of unknown function (DUF1549)/Protein of unknown function (DUF1553)